jgi:uncharacterized protein YdbL (DUF1318 family)
MKARICLAVFAVILLCSTSMFADSSRDDIKKRMKQRYPMITEMKEKGKIGETHLGYIDLINPEAKKDSVVLAILRDENTDRELLYNLIAEQTETNPELVGRQNAFRIFQKAGDDEYFKAADGQWRRKKDMKVEKKQEDK